MRERRREDIELEVEKQEAEGIKEVEEQKKR